MIYRKKGLTSNLYCNPLLLLTRVNKYAVFNSSCKYWHKLPPYFYFIICTEWMQLSTKRIINRTELFDIIHRIWRFLEPVCKHLLNSMSSVFSIYLLISHCLDEIKTIIYKSVTYLTIINCVSYLCFCVNCYLDDDSSLQK